MTATLRISPVRKSILVKAGARHAFEVFTAGIDRWWPKSHSIGSAPMLRAIIEPFVGGRWYTPCEDGTEAVIGHVRAWEPGEKFIVSWEISAAWKPDARAAFASEVEVRFIAQSDGQTRIEVEHRDFERMGSGEGEAMRGAVENGWPGLLALFAKEAAAAR